MNIVCAGFIQESYRYVYTDSGEYQTYCRLRKILLKSNSFSILVNSNSNSLSSFQFRFQVLSTLFNSNFKSNQFLSIPVSVLSIPINSKSRIRIGIEKNWCMSKSIAHGNEKTNYISLWRISRSIFLKRD